MYVHICILYILCIVPVYHGYALAWPNCQAEWESKKNIKIPHEWTKRLPKIFSIVAAAHANVLVPTTTMKMKVDLEKNDTKIVNNSFSIWAAICNIIVQAEVTFYLYLSSNSLISMYNIERNKRNHYYEVDSKQMGL